MVLAEEIEEPQIEDMQEDWPGWTLWRTENWWNAARRPPRLDVPEGFFSRRGDLAVTLLEDGPSELLAALENQAAIEEEFEPGIPSGRRPGRAKDADGKDEWQLETCTPCNGSGQKA